MKPLAGHVTYSPRLGGSRLGKEAVRPSSQFDHAPALMRPRPSGDRAGEIVTPRRTAGVLQEAEGDATVPKAPEQE